jgi:hypothetical protein
MMENGGVVPRQPGDVPCGGLPYITTLVAKTRGAGVNHQEVRTVHRLYNHIEQVVLPRYRVDTIAGNRHLRIKYLTNEIDEEKLKYLLQSSEKKNNKQTELYQVLQMLLQVMLDIFQRMDRVPTKKTWEEMNAIRQHYNASIMKINNIYKSKAATLFITDKWEMGTH